MKYSKLVIVSTNELDKRIGTLFGLVDMVTSGLEIEYWNISELTYNEKLNQEDIFGIKYVTFKDRRSFETCVKGYSGCKSTLFLIYANYAPETYFCYRALSRIKAHMAYCVNGVLPPYEFAVSQNQISINRLYCYIRNRWYSILKKTKLLAPLKYQLNTCANAKVDYKVDKSTIYVPYNSGDYETGRSSSERLINERYIVFVDQYMPYHTDNHGAIDADQYYPSHNAFFDNIERLSGMKVVIAAHPSAYKYHEVNPFNNREIFWGKTKQLIEHSEIVINNFSTAMSIAVIYKKPIIFLTCDQEMSKLYHGHAISESMSRMLGCPFYNVDHMTRSLDVPEVNENKYNEYYYGYITNIKSEKKKNSEILMSIIKGYYG